MTSDGALFPKPKNNKFAQTVGPHCVLSSKKSSAICSWCIHKEQSAASQSNFFCCLNWQIRPQKLVVKPWNQCVANAPGLMLVPATVCGPSAASTPSFLFRTFMQQVKPRASCQYYGRLIGVLYDRSGSIKAFLLAGQCNGHRICRLCTRKVHSVVL